EGSAFRPLYDERILFNGQPIALVVAEDAEIARFAASLVRVDCAEEAHVTDVHRRRDEAVPLELGKMFGPPKPRGTPEAASAAAKVRHTGEYYVPIEHHNPMELFAATAVCEGGPKLTVYPHTHALHNVHPYL